MRNSALQNSFQTSTLECQWAYGMGIKSRAFEGFRDFRYGFSGKEKVDEISGSGNNYDFGARIYDARLGRWMSIDPLAGKYPDFSPYSSSLCNPVQFKDKDGGVITDDKGNIIVTTEGRTGGYEEVGPSTTNAKGETTRIEYSVTKLVATAYTDKYEPFQIEIVINVTAKKVTTDENGMTIKTEDATVNTKQFDASSNCHGLAYLKGQGWIADPSPILRDEYSKSNSSTANIVVSVEKSTQMIGHSTKKNANGTFTAKNTDHPIQANTTFIKAGGEFANSKVWQQNFYKKNATSNTVLPGLPTLTRTFKLYGPPSDTEMPSVTDYSTEQIKGFQFVSPTSIPKPVTEIPK